MSSSQENTLPMDVILQSNFLKGSGHSETNTNTKPSGLFKNNHNFVYYRNIGFY